jgi:hypothetical protein
MDISKLSSLVSSKSLIGRQQFSFYQEVVVLDCHIDVIEYLEKLVPIETYIASGIRVKTANGIIEENEEGVAPGGYLAPYGYLVIATSFGGNAICVNCATGATYWADQSSFTEDEISYENRETGDWVDLPFSADNILYALIPIEKEFETFLSKLLDNQFNELFDKLD